MSWSAHDCSRRWPSRCQHLPSIRARQAVGFPSLHWCDERPPIERKRRRIMFTDLIAMEHALQEARLALTNETIPVGSVLISPDGELIGRGRNCIYSAGDCSGHAEIEAIRDAGSLLLRPVYFQRCTLYTTAEPCMMCTGAILAAGV